ncbi:MAG TPA: hypothetical protein VHF90_03590 [Thermoleophilaceae bacterium]|nr:hypothetical protein [Thermoleophilaceae bacterium]
MTIRTALRQPWTAILLALLLSALALAGCSDGEGAAGGADEEAQALLDRAFRVPVPSANVDVDLQLDLEGLAGFEDPLRITATGPYVRVRDSLPKLDLDIAFEAQGAGQAIESGVLSTGDRVFLKFGGGFYEQPADQVARANRRLAGAGEGSGSFSDLGLDARRWIGDARIDGEDEVGGVSTKRVTGTLDVEAALRDLNRLVRRSSGALGDAASAARPLGAPEIERLARSVESPTFDVYVGEDDVVRRISLRIDVDVPERDRSDVGGITGASIRLALQLEDVGGDQVVEAPPSARPLSELMSQIGSLSALTGSGDDPEDGGTTTTPAPGDAAGGDPGGLDDFERYSDCLDAADPDDSAAIARCRALLP